MWAMGCRRGNVPNRLILPPTLHQWPVDQQLQWVADELWGAATGEPDPAPPSYVAIVDQVLTIGVNRG